MQISVMSFNIQHCLNYRTRQIDFDLFAQVIRQSGADIVGLNEVNGRVQAQTICRRLRFWPKGWDFTPISHKRSRLMVSSLRECAAVPLLDRDGADHSHTGSGDTRICRVL